VLFFIDYRSQMWRTKRTDWQNRRRNFTISLNPRSEIITIIMSPLHGWHNNWSTNGVGHLQTSGRPLSCFSSGSQILITMKACLLTFFFTFLKVFRCLISITLLHFYVSNFLLLCVFCAAIRRNKWMIIMDWICRIHELRCTDRANHKILTLTISVKY